MWMLNMKDFSVVVGPKEERDLANDGSTAREHLIVAFNPHKYTQILMLRSS